MGAFFVCGMLCWRNKKKVTCMIDQAQDHINAELDIVNLVHNLRNLRDLLKSPILSDHYKFNVYHGRKLTTNFNEPSSSRMSAMRDSDDSDSSPSASHNFEEIQERQIPDSTRAMNQNPDLENALKLL